MHLFSYLLCHVWVYLLYILFLLDQLVWYVVSRWCHPVHHVINKLNPNSKQTHQAKVHSELCSDPAQSTCCSIQSFLLLQWNFPKSTFALSSHPVSSARFYHETVIKMWDCFFWTLRTWSSFCGATLKEYEMMRHKEKLATLNFLLPNDWNNRIMFPSSFCVLFIDFLW